METSITQSGAKTTRVAKFNIVNDEFEEAYGVKVPK
jgi:hypothetical protein